MGHSSSQAEPPKCAPNPEAKIEFRKNFKGSPEEQILAALKWDWQYFNNKGQNRSLKGVSVFKDNEKLEELEHLRQKEAKNELKEGDLEKLAQLTQWEKKRIHPSSADFPEYHTMAYFEEFYRRYCKNDFRSDAKKLKKDDPAYHVQQMVNGTKANGELFALKYGQYLISRSKEIPPSLVKELTQRENLSGAQDVGAKLVLSKNAELNAKGGHLTANPGRNCDEIDLTHPRHDKKGLFQEPRDQDSTGWCAGFSAADMISSRLGKKVSAVALVKTFQDKYAKLRSPVQKRRFSIAGPSPSKTTENAVEEYGCPPLQVGCINQTSIFKAAVEKGVCLEDDVPSWDSSLQGYSSDREEIPFHSTPPPTRRGSIGNYIRKECFEEFQEKNYSTVLRLYGDSKRLTEFQHNKIQDYLDDCERLKLYEKDFEVTQKLANPETLNDINKHLEQGNMVMAGISHGFFMTSDPRHVASFLGEPDGDHAVLVVGRGKRTLNLLRMKEADKNTCGYLIRNSWGKDCRKDLDTPEVQCDPKTGLMWVSESRFIQMVDKTTTFDHPMSRPLDASDSSPPILRRSRSRENPGQNSNNDRPKLRKSQEAPN